MAEARRAGCGALVAVEPENLFYMTGFWGEATGVLGAGGRATILAPALEADRARSEAADCEIIGVDRGTAVREQLSRLVGRSRVCTDCCAPAMMRTIRAAAASARQDAAPFLAARMIKDAGEMRILRAASRVIDEMFELCTHAISPGMRESEVQSRLMSFAIERGLFDTGYRYTTNPLIVAGGPNSALPHAQVTRRRIRRGDLVTVDITLRHRGYVSDATRTFAAGRVSAEKSCVYSAVRESQELGLRAVRAGARCSDVDRACRQVIADAGYAARFVHSTGHGIGLDVHERPALSPRSRDVLARGMAVTVEPGIYIPSRFGVRIEDSVAVGAAPSAMHKFTKDLVVL